MLCFPHTGQPYATLKCTLRMCRPTLSTDIGVLHPSPSRSGQYASHGEGSCVCMCVGEEVNEGVGEEVNEGVDEGSRQPGLTQRSSWWIALKCPRQAASRSPSWAPQPGSGQQKEAPPSESLIGWYSSGSGAMGDFLCLVLARRIGAVEDALRATSDACWEGK